MIRLLTLGPAEHEEVAIYVVNQRIPHVRELREQLCCGAIRGYQVRGKILFDPNIICILVGRLCTLRFFYRSLHGFYIITHIRNAAFPIGSTQLYDGRAYDSAV